MAIDLGTLPLVTFISDQDTPNDLKQYDKLKLLLGSGIVLPPVGTFDTLIINGVTVPGYLREGAGGAYEWVMRPPVDPVVEALESIPGASGWVSAPAKQAYAEVGAQFLGRGATLTDARDALRSLYQAAEANLAATGQL